MFRTLFFTGMLILAFSTGAVAVNPTTQPADLLGELWDGEEIGLIMRLPAGAVEVRRAATAGTELARFRVEERGWTLTVSRVLLERPAALETRTNLAGSVIPGYLDMTEQTMLRDTPGTVLRKDILHLPAGKAGSVLLHSSIGTETFLTQRLVLPLTDRIYFHITLLSPVPRENYLDDPGLRLAVRTFNAITQTIEVVDQGDLRLEQESRLLRMRDALVNITETRLRDALVESRWLRVRQDGRDVGYSFVMERIATDIPRDDGSFPAGGEPGVLIAVRNHSNPEGRTTVDSEIWMWMSLDRRRESWINTIVVDQGKPTEQFVRELGTANSRTRMPDGTMDNTWRVDVRFIARGPGGGEVVQRTPPAFYLPAALTHLLPRLLPLHQPGQFMYAHYVSARREIMPRYVDLLPQQRVEIDGVAHQAFVVEERVGLRGSTMRHYYSLEGRHLASENRESRTWITPSDEQTLRAIWGDRLIDPPAGVNRE